MVTDTEKFTKLFERVQQTFERKAKPFSWHDPRKTARLVSAIIKFF